MTDKQLQYELIGDGENAPRFVFYDLDHIHTSREVWENTLPANHYIIRHVDTGEVVSDFKVTYGKWVDA